MGEAAAGTSCAAAETSCAAAGLHTPRARSHPGGEAAPPVARGRCERRRPAGSGRRCLAPPPSPHWRRPYAARPRHHEGNRPAGGPGQCHRSVRQQQEGHRGRGAFPLLWAFLPRLSSPPRSPAAASQDPSAPSLPRVACVCVCVWPAPSPSLSPATDGGGRAPLTLVFPLRGFGAGRLACFCCLRGSLVSVGRAAPVVCVHGLNVFLCNQNRLLAWLTGMASVGSAVRIPFLRGLHVLTLELLPPPCVACLQWPGWPDYSRALLLCAGSAPVITVSYGFSILGTIIRLAFLLCFCVLVVPFRCFYSWLVCAIYNGSCLPALLAWTGSPVAVTSLRGGLQALTLQ